MTETPKTKSRWVVFISSPIRATGDLDGFLKILEEYTPRVEYRRGCEAFLEFGLSRGGEPPPLERIRSLNRDLARLGIPIRCGVGPNKFLARAAARLSGAGEAFWILPQGGRDFLEGLSVDLWPGLGEKKIARLRSLGIRRIGDLGRVEPSWVRMLWGKSGLVLRERARGYDPRPVHRRLPRRDPERLLPQPRLFPPRDREEKLKILGQLGRYLRRIYGRTAARIGGGYE